MYRLQRNMHGYNKLSCNRKHIIQLLHSQFENNAKNIRQGWDKNIIWDNLPEDNYLVLKKFYLLVQNNDVLRVRIIKDIIFRRMQKCIKQTAIIWYFSVCAYNIYK